MVGHLGVDLKCELHTLSIPETASTGEESLAAGHNDSAS